MSDEEIPEDDLDNFFNSDEDNEESKDSVGNLPGLVLLSQQANDGQSSKGKKVRAAIDSNVFKVAFDIPTTP